MSEINRIVARVKFNTVYACADCGRRQVGDARTTEFDGHSGAELQQHLEAIPHKPQYMPVGWSHDTAYHCGCITKGEVPA